MSAISTFKWKHILSASLTHYLNVAEIVDTLTKSYSLHTLTFRNWLRFIIHESRYNRKITIIIFEFPIVNFPFFNTFMSTFMCCMYIKTDKVYEIGIFDIRVNCCNTSSSNNNEESKKVETLYRLCDIGLHCTQELANLLREDYAMQICGFIQLNSWVYYAIQICGFVQLNSWVYYAINICGFVLLNSWVYYAIQICGFAQLKSWVYCMFL